MQNAKSIAANQKNENKHEEYQYGDYNVRVFFSGGKTLAECLRDLAVHQIDKEYMKKR